MAERLTREEIRVLMGPADDVSITELVDLGMTRAELTGHAARALRPRRRARIRAKRQVESRLAALRAKHALRCGGRMSSDWYPKLRSLQMLSLRAALPYPRAGLSPVRHVFFRVVM
jgi:hypothetical protein